MKVLNKKCIVYVIVSKYSLTIKLTKKEKILQTALDLFANEGFNAVSTRRIADAAGVSEGLIFRHFESKKGLLSIIMAQAENRIQEIFHSILLSKDPSAVIRDTINLVFTVDQEEYDFWRLQYKLKWQKEYYNPEKMKPVEDKLAWAFSELCFQNPALEADLLIKTIDAIAIEILQGGFESQERLRIFLIDKYKVNEQ